MPPSIGTEEDFPRLTASSPDSGEEEEWNGEGKRKGIMVNTIDRSSSGRGRGRNECEREGVR